MPRRHVSVAVSKSSTGAFAKWLQLGLDVKEIAADVDQQELSDALDAKALDHSDIPAGHMPL